MGATSTINIRINTALKERGDAVLKQNGISTSEAIRMLWEELERTHQLPEFLLRRQADRDQLEKKRKLAALDRLTGIARLSPKEQELFSSYETLRDSMYDDMLEEYLELS